MANGYRQSIYGSKWRILRQRHLQLFPMCVLCAELGIVEPATVVDHREPHRGNAELFYDENNLQSLCKTCHDSAKQAQEHSGHMRGSRLDGTPLDVTHPWYREDQALADEVDA